MDRGYGGGRGRQQHRGDHRGADRSRSDRGGGDRGSGGGGQRNAPAGVCNEWSKTGNCKFGDRCRYSHGSSGGGGGGGGGGYSRGGGRGGD